MPCNVLVDYFSPLLSDLSHGLSWSQRGTLKRGIVRNWLFHWLHELLKQLRAHFCSLFVFSLFCTLDLSQDFLELSFEWVSLLLLHSVVASMAILSLLLVAFSAYCLSVAWKLCGRSLKRSIEVEGCASDLVEYTSWGLLFGHRCLELSVCCGGGYCRKI